MNKVMLLLLATSVAFGATTLHLVGELRAERKATESLQARLAELDSNPAFASPFTSAPPVTTPSATDAPPPAATPAASPPAATFAAASTTAVDVSSTNGSREDRIRLMRESMERQRALLQDPEYRDAMRTQQKAMLAQAYPDLAAELGLTGDEADRFTTLLADQQLRAMDNQSGPFLDGPPDPATAQEMHRKAQALRQTLEEEIKGLLGEEKWAAWRDYQSTLGVRHQVSQLRTTLAMSGAPLSEEQVRPLQRALAEAQRQQMEEWSRSAQRMQAALSPGPSTPPSAAAQLELHEEHLRRQSEQNERLRSSLSSILSAEQLRRIEEQHDVQLRLQEAHVRMMRAQAEAEARGEITSPATTFFAGEGVMVTSGAVNVASPSP